MTVKFNCVKTIIDNKSVKTGDNCKSTIVKQEFDKFEKKQTSTAKKIGIATGILATIGAITAIVITRGKALQKAKMNKLLDEIPKDLQARFSKIKNLEGEAFTNKAYDELVEHMGLKGIAPKQIQFEGAQGSMGHITGGYDSIENVITFTHNLKNAPKASQIELLSHELVHCKQFTNMLRTEGITVDMYVKSKVENMINIAKKNDFGFNLAYSRAERSGKLSEFMKNVRENWTKDCEKLVRKNFEDVLKMPKFKVDSSEGVKALKDLQSVENYEGLGLLGLGSQAYKSHPHEVEAYGYGEKLAELFKKYLTASN